MRHLLWLGICAGIWLGYGTGTSFGPIHAEARVVKERIRLAPKLQAQLIVLIDEGARLHEVATQGDRAALVKQVARLRRALTQTQQLSPMAKVHRVHLDRTLGSLAAPLNRLRESPDSTFKPLLQESFRQLLQIARSYEIPHKYNYFFCGIDKSSWYQSGKAPRNPVNPTGRTAKCGTLMQ